MFAGEGASERTTAVPPPVQGQPAIRLSTAFELAHPLRRRSDRRPDISAKSATPECRSALWTTSSVLYSGFDLGRTGNERVDDHQRPGTNHVGVLFQHRDRRRLRAHAQAKGRWPAVQAKIDQWLAARGCARATYRGTLPRGTTGPALAFSACRLIRWWTAPTTKASRPRIGHLARHSAGRHSQRGPGAKYVHFLDRVRPANDGRRPTVFFSTTRCAISTRFRSAATTSRAGANPVTQLAFTLANGFTLLEYYKSRGMPVDAFAPNLSFFFSNGLDPEYAVNRPRGAAHLVGGIEGALRRQ